MRGPSGHNSRPLVQFPPSILGMDDLTRRIFYSQATWVIGMVDLFFDPCSPSVLVQPGTGGRPVDWCRNQKSVL